MSIRYSFNVFSSIEIFLAASSCFSSFPTHCEKKGIVFLTVCVELVGDNKQLSS